MSTVGIVVVGFTLVLLGFDLGYWLARYLDHRDLERRWRQAKLIQATTDAMTERIDRSIERLAV